MGSGIGSFGKASLLALGLVSAAVPPAGAGERMLRTEVDWNAASPPAPAKRSLKVTLAESGSPARP
jgi:hypothetical protein